MSIKKWFSLFFTVLLLMLLLPGSLRAEESQDTTPLKIVVTIFPEYDWICQVLGEDSDAKVTLLLDEGVDMHSFAPTAQDILTIADCDLFVYTGGESDAWIEEALQAGASSDRVTLNLMEVLADSLLEERVMEGMTEESSEDSHTEKNGDSTHTAMEEADEHIWLSLRNAQVCTRAISDTLCSIDPLHADLYRQNSEAYTTRLAALDTLYQETIDASSGSALVIADRYPFRYLAEDYALTCYAAFPGCSAETEASFETVIFLTGKLDELDLDTILVTETSDGKLADTIINSSARKDCRILVLDSLQKTSLQDYENGVTYLSVMKANLDVLAQALS